MLKVAERLRARLIGLSRRSKRLLQVGADVVLIWVALWLAFVLRLGSLERLSHSVSTLGYLLARRY